MLRSSSIYIIITMNEYVPYCFIENVDEHHYDDTRMALVINLKV